MEIPVKPMTPEQLKLQELRALHESWFHKDAVAFDDMVNVFAGGNPDETISARMARWATEDNGFKQDLGVAVCKALNVVSKDHGAKAEISDLMRAKNIEAIEEATPTYKEENQ